MAGGPEGRDGHGRRGLGLARRACRRELLATARDACAEFTEKSGAGEALTKDLIEWLAEWGRDLRRKQTGLLLLTAHRAKGLEFDHVVVLDGSWERRGSGEDRDAGAGSTTSP